MKTLAIVLVSGGLDSCVTAAIANQSYQLAFLHVNYGQRTEKRELKAFMDIADYYKVKHRLVTFSFLLERNRGVKFDQF
ncbi:7-cyano-7-deazaguanine synthase [Candidatus Methanoperedenaceae archaeon GB50]|nr:7-cyano-7-deazaguanine synthase [Candidatus Methanoperedenaceae archaeon GB50]